jgi:PAS domain-containing protein
MPAHDNAAGRGPASSVLASTRPFISHSSPDVVIDGLGDYAGQFIVSDPLSRVLGWTPKELTSCPYWEFVHADDRDSVAEDLLRPSSPGVFRTWDLRLLTRDGRFRWTRWIGQWDEAWIVASGMEHIERPFTDMQRFGIGVWTWIPRTDEVRSSREVFEMHGLDYAHSLMCSRLELRHLIHEDDRRQVDETLLWSLATGEPYETHYRVAEPTIERWFHSWGRVEFGPRKEPLSIQGIVKCLN